MAGYSTTPLARKLGIDAGCSVALLDEPDHFRELLEPIPDGVEFRTTVRGRADVVVAFFVRRSLLRRRMGLMSRAVFPAGGLWIAWPKKASGVPTDITEDTIRAEVLGMGLVDNKVCAIDETWSGLRLVWRKEHR